MTILARYKPLGIDVRVVDVIHQGSRKRVLIQALNGKRPFCVNTHGGPASADSAYVFPDSLTDFKQDGQPIRKSRVGAGERPEPLPAEWASLFPARACKFNPNRGGPNND